VPAKGADPDAHLSTGKRETAAVLYFERQMREGRERTRGRVTSEHTMPSPSPPFVPDHHSVAAAHSALVSPTQAPVDPELSLYEPEEDSPSYWDLEQVS